MSCNAVAMVKARVSLDYANGIKKIFSDDQIYNLVGSFLSAKFDSVSRVSSPVWNVKGEINERYTVTVSERGIYIEVPLLGSGNEFGANQLATEINDYLKRAAVVYLKTSVKKTIRSKGGRIVDEKGNAKGVVLSFEL